MAQPQSKPPVRSAAAKLVDSSMQCTPVVAPVVQQALRCRRNTGTARRAFAYAFFFVGPRSAQRGAHPRVDMAVGVAGASGRAHPAPRLAAAAYGGRGRFATLMLALARVRTLAWTSLLS
jgi:hypothetical protein